MSIEDQPTQQIRHLPPAAPMPGPLNPTGSQPAAPPVAEANDGSTDVLALDDLFEAPATTAAPPAAVAPAPAAPPTAAPAAPAAPTPAVPPAAGPRHIGAVPAAPSRRQPGLVDRLRGDGAAAWQGGLTRSRDWVSTGDNALIVATAVVALLLLLVVALV